MALALLALLAACVDSPGTASSSQDLAITVRLHNAKLDFTRTFVHRADDHHRCVTPGRIRLLTAAKPGPSPEDPPDYAAGYSVQFGPDPSTLEEGGSTVPMGGVVPALPPLNNPIVNYFSPEDRSAAGPAADLGAGRAVAIVFNRDDGPGCLGRAVRRG